jgi:hypothetical protein
LVESSVGNRSNRLNANCAVTVNPAKIDSRSSKSSALLIDVFYSVVNKNRFPSREGKRRIIKEGLETATIAR